MISITAAIQTLGELAEQAEARGDRSAAWQARVLLRHYEALQRFKDSTGKE